MRKFLLNRKFVLTLALWTILISIPPSNAFAMQSASVSTFDAVSLRQVQMSNIMAQLSRPEARAHMMLMGMNQNQLKEKLAQLDDAQLASVSKKADAIKVAGDGGLGLIVVLLVIGILAIIFVRLYNNKKIT
jgi:hypothetical protein